MARDKVTEGEWPFADAQHKVRAMEQRASLGERKTYVESVTAWASSLAVALATGVATVILAGLQPFVTGIINPPEAPTAPQAPSVTAPR